MFVGWRSPPPYLIREVRETKVNLSSRQDAEAKRVAVSSEQAWRTHIPENSML